jgi:hypothetical protein
MGVLRRSRVVERRSLDCNDCSVTGSIPAVAAHRKHGTARVCVTRVRNTVLQQLRLSIVGRFENPASATRGKARRNWFPGRFRRRAQRARRGTNLEETGPRDGPGDD